MGDLAAYDLEAHDVGIPLSHGVDVADGYGDMIDCAGESLSKYLISLYRKNRAGHWTDRRHVFVQDRKSLVGLFQSQQERHVQMFYVGYSDGPCGS